MLSPFCDRIDRAFAAPALADEEAERQAHWAELKQRCSASARLSTLQG